MLIVILQIYCKFLRQGGREIGIVCFTCLDRGDVKKMAIIHDRHEVSKVRSGNSDFWREWKWMNETCNTKGEGVRHMGTECQDSSAYSRFRISSHFNILLSLCSL